MMQISLSALILVGLLLFWTDAPKATQDNVDEAVELIVLFCVAGGKEIRIESDTTLSGGVGLKVLGLAGETDLKITKSEAQGLVRGLRSKMDGASAQQASEARACMKPYIDRILNILLGNSGTEQSYGRLIWTYEYLAVSVDDLTVIGNNKLRVRFDFRNIAKDGRGLALALKAQHAGGIADFWKFFPKSEAFAADDGGNEYAIQDPTCFGWARDNNDWSILNNGQRISCTASFEKRSSNPIGETFKISLPIWVVWVPNTGGNQQRSSVDVSFEDLYEK